MKQNCPDSWKSPEEPPALRRMTAEEGAKVSQILIPFEKFTNGVVIKLVEAYRQAVGYDESKTNSLLGRTGLCDGRGNLLYEGDEVYRFSSGFKMIDFRLGRPGWDHTKLVVDERWNNPCNYFARVDPNLHYEHLGTPEEDIAMQIKFAELSLGLLGDIIAQPSK